jgi:hypothetical protein
VTRCCVVGGRSGVGCPLNGSQVYGGSEPRGGNSPLTKVSKDWIDKPSVVAILEAACCCVVGSVSDVGCSLDGPKSD